MWKLLIVLGTTSYWVDTSSTCCTSFVSEPQMFLFIHIERKKLLVADIHCFLVQIWLVYWCGKLIIPTGWTISLLYTIWLLHCKAVLNNQAELPELGGVLSLLHCVYALVPLYKHVGNKYELDDSRSSFQAVLSYFVEVQQNMLNMQQSIFVFVLTLKYLNMY